MEAGSEILRHHQRDGISRIYIKKSMEHLLDTSFLVETAESPDLHKRFTFSPRRSLRLSKTLTFNLFLALLAMIVLRGLKILLHLLWSLDSAFAALQIVPGAAWTDVRICPFTMYHSRV